MVSVIIPNYNHGLYLEQRITSVLNQTYQDFEVIILDDFSSDNSRDIIEQYLNHAKVSQVVFNEKNSGSVFKQWQKGINLAKGDFIWIAESDDFADPFFLEKTKLVLDQDQTIGFVYSNSYIVKSDGNSFSETYADRRNISYNTDKWSRSYTNDGREEIKANLILGCTVNNASAVLFRKQALVKLFPLQKDFRYIGDWYCYLNICLNYKISYLNESLNYYREHSVNASKNLSKGLRSIVEYFYLYDWALNNIHFVDKEVIINRFNIFTRHNGFRNWNIKKISIYYHLFNINSSLFLTLIKENTVEPYFHRIEKFLKI